MSKLMRNFRKHQKAVLAVTGVLIIFVFTVGAYIADWQATAPPSEAAQTVVVTYKGGQITEQELGMMISAHYRAVMGCSAVGNAGMAKGQMPHGYFVIPGYIWGIPPNYDEATVMQIRLLAEKGRQLGMEVDNPAVTQFLMRLYGVPEGSKTSEGDIRAILTKELGEQMSILQFYEQMKIELLAQNTRFLARTVLTASDPRTMEISPTPGEAYSYFERLNRYSEIESLPVKVEDYIDKVEGKPSSGELQELYDKYKEQMASPYSDEPGFRVPQKIALQYVKADFTKLLEEEKKKITEEQIQAEYERGVAAGQFTVPELAEEPQPGPDEKPDETKPDETKPDEPASDEVKPDESKPEATKPEDAKPEEDKPESTDPPADDSQKPEDKAPEAEAPKADEAKPEPEETAPEGGCQEAAPATDEEGAAEDKPSEEPTENQPVEDRPTKENPAEDKPAEEKPAEQPAEDKPTDDPAGEDKSEDKPGEEKPSEDKPAEQPPSEAPETTKPGEKKVQPLEKVRDQILNSLAARPAQERLQKALSEVEKEVLKHARETLSARRQAEEETDKTKQAALKEEVKPFDVAAVAKEQGLEFRVIPLSGPFELDEMEIGKASGRVQGQQVSFIQTAFQPNKQLFQPEVVTSFADGGEHLFMYWLTDQTADYVPSFEEVREEVEESWKLLQARELAQADAKQKAESLEKGQSLKEAFGEQVTASGKFTWLRGPNTPFGFGGAPTFSEVAGVQLPGEDFMREVFNLGVGEAGVAPNTPRSIYYVVRVTSRSPDDEILREQFAGSRFGYRSTTTVARLERSELEQMWFEDLEEEFNVEWKRDPRQMSRGG